MMKKDLTSQVIDKLVDEYRAVSPHATVADSHSYALGYLSSAIERLVETTPAVKHLLIDILARRK